MPLVNIEFEVTPGNGTQAYWIAVDDQDVKLKNGRGVHRTNSPGEHTLVWWFVGNEGSTLAIVGKVAGRTVVEIKKSTISPGRTKGSGAVPFTLP